MHAGDDRGVQPRDRTHPGVGRQPVEGDVVEGGVQGVAGVDRDREEREGRGAARSAAGVELRGEELAQRLRVVLAQGRPGHLHRLGRQRASLLTSLCVEGQSAAEGLVLPDPGGERGRDALRRRVRQQHRQTDPRGPGRVAVRVLVEAAELVEARRSRVGGLFAPAREGGGVELPSDDVTAQQLLVGPRAGDHAASVGVGEVRCKSGSGRRVPRPLPV